MATEPGTELIIIDDPIYTATPEQQTETRQRVAKWFDEMPERFRRVGDPPRAGKSEVAKAVAGYLDAVRNAGPIPHDIFEPLPLTHITFTATIPPKYAEAIAELMRDPE